MYIRRRRETIVARPIFSPRATDRRRPGLLDLSIASEPSLQGIRAIPRLSSSSSSLLLLCFFYYFNTSSWLIILDSKTASCVDRRRVWALSLWRWRRSEVQRHFALAARALGVAPVQHHVHKALCAGPHY